jgi:NAD(P)H-nitrite reductase large subunit
VEVGRGVVVNDHLATAETDIWAAGSCAEVHTSGRALIQASWANAMAQGKAAGMNMAGGDEVYCKGSDYMTQVGGTKFSLFGAPAAAYPNARFVVFDPEDGPYGALLEEGGVVRGGILAGRHKKARVIKALQLSDDPVPGLADLGQQNDVSVDEFYEQALGE